MRIFRFRYAFKDGDAVFRNLVPADKYVDWYSESREAVAKHQTLEMEWSEGSGNKSVGDFISSVAPGISGVPQVIRQLTQFAPSASVGDIRVGNDHFSFLKAKNFNGIGENFDHIFLLYPPYAFELVTEPVKQFCESFKLQGCVFEFVTELPDSNFRLIDQAALPSANN